MARYRKQNTLQNTLKDYIVPIIWGIIILLLLIRFFSWGNDELNNNVWDTNIASWIDITFLNDSTEAFIAFGNNSQEQISQETDLFAGETITVREWVVELSESSGTKINLNRIAEFTYNSDNNYSLKSSDAFLTLNQDSSISMRYAVIDAPAGSVLSLTQNEAGSTIYVLAGNTKVANLAWVDTTLTAWQKISISRINASNEDIDLSSEKTDIDSFFKTSDWFLDNDWHIILENSIKTATSDENIEEWDIAWSEGNYISFSNLQDELSTESANLEVTWNINSDEVEIITINNQQVTRSGESFSYTIPLKNGINDIVVKIFSTNKDILEKNVFTIYSSANSSTAQNTNINSTINSGVTTYDVNANDFGFTEPSVTWKYTTNFWEVTIRGITTAEGISKVEVNGFELGSFNGSTWRYHAFQRFETLEEGTNQYKVDYYWNDWNIVYTDYFTIVKQSNSPTETSLEDNIISDEV